MNDMSNQPVHGHQGTHDDATLNMLRDSVQDFSARMPGPARLRRIREQAPYFDRDAWQRMVESGWCSVLVPEQLGGAGLGLRAASVICRELGSALAPEPYVACGLLSTQLLADAGESPASAALLRQIAEDGRLVCVAWQDRANNYDPLVTVASAAFDGDTIMLHKSGKCFVPAAAAAQDFIVTATIGSALCLIRVPADAPGLTIDVQRTVDGLACGTLSMDDVRLPKSALLASGEAVGKALAGALDAARLMSSFELLGIMQRALDATVAYTKTRIQFGRPIATYQVLQHRMVDMWMQLQLASAAAEDALQAMTSGAAGMSSVPLAVSAAKARAANAALFIGKAAIQLHGAMGIADETDIGLCLKRAVVLSAWLGNADWQRARYFDLWVSDALEAELDCPSETVVTEEGGDDMASLPDEVFRLRLRNWIETHYPEEKRFMKKRAFYEDIRDWYQILSKKGWLAPAWPKAWGGMELSAPKQVIYYEEIARHGCARIPDHGIVVGQLLIQHGTEAQKNFHLPRILNGDDMWCQGYSEPNAGSDLASLRTRAERDGDMLVVNGQKIWTTLAAGANWMFALVRTGSSERDRQHGITFLLIDLHTPGVEVRPILNIKGESEFCEVFFNDVRVPVANVVGAIDEGWSVANSMLRHERIFFGTPRQCEYALGQLTRLVRATWSNERPASADRYAALLLDVRDLKSAFEQFVGRLRAGEELGSEVSYLKIWGTETYQRITDELINLAGDHGGLLDDIELDGVRIDVMNQYLDSRAPTIFSGSNEIQRNILAKQILELPSWGGAKR